MFSVLFPIFNDENYSEALECLIFTQYKVTYSRKEGAQIWRWDMLPSPSLCVCFHEDVRLNMYLCAYSSRGKKMEAAVFLCCILHYVLGHDLSNHWRIGCLATKLQWFTYFHLSLHPALGVQVCITVYGFWSYILVIWTQVLIFSGQTFFFSKWVFFLTQHSDIAMVVN